MPITINGSGTVTGISAGGLPDDCITTAEIAAAAVTTAKLGSSEASGLAKAWVNFNGTFATSPFTIANGGIRASFNVSSITDNGVGDYTVNFTTALADVNYCAVGQSGYTSSAVGAGSVAFNRIGTSGNESAPTTGSIRVNAIASNGDATADQVYIYVAIFR